MSYYSEPPDETWQKLQDPLVRVEFSAGRFNRTNGVRPIHGGTPGDVVVTGGKGTANILTEGREVVVDG